ncbi:MAG: hypothetical protein ACTSVL_08055 [Promethearchaeota archaeon]
MLYTYPSVSNLSLNFLRAWILVFICILIILEIQDISRNYLTWKIVCKDIQSAGQISPSIKSFFNIRLYLLHIGEKWKYCLKVIFTKKFPRGKRTAIQLAALFFSSIFIFTIFFLGIDLLYWGLPKEEGVDYYYWLRIMIAKNYGILNGLILTLLGGGLIFIIVQLNLKYKQDFKEYYESKLIASHQNTLENLDFFNKFCAEIEKNHSNNQGEQK